MSSPPPNWRQRAAPVPQLPPEVLLIILNKVERAKDLYTCSQSSRLLHQLLELDKQCWCFQLLLPHLLPHLDLHDVLNLRLVCGEWQDSVETLLEDWNRPCTSDKDRDHHPLGIARGQGIRKLTLPLTITDNVVTSRPVIENLVQRFQGCRIVGGSVLLGDGFPVNARVDYWGCTMTFLKTFGPQITSLTIYLLGFNYSATEIFTVSQLVLRECPNVRKVQYGALDTPRRDFISDMVRKGLPLPQLPKLESLVMSVMLSQALNDELLEKYGSQLKWLEFSFYSGVTLNPLGNLTELFVRFPEPPRDAVDMDLVRRLLDVPSRHLQKLTLLLELDVHLFLSTLLDICDQFPLRILKVAGQVDTHLFGPGPVTGGRVRRTLKSLEFFDGIGVDSFNFLEFFPSLEYLHLKGAYHTGLEGGAPITREIVEAGKPRYGVRSEAVETVQIRQFLYPEEEEQIDDMYRSNLWRVCPRLKKFVFEYCWEGRRYWTALGRRDPDEHKPRVYTRQGFWNHLGI